MKRVEEDGKEERKMKKRKRSSDLLILIDDLGVSFEAQATMSA